MKRRALVALCVAVVLAFGSPAEAGVTSTVGEAVAEAAATFKQIVKKVVKRAKRAVAKAKKKRGKSSPPPVVAAPAPAPAPGPSPAPRAVPTQCNGNDPAALVDHVLSRAGYGPDPLSRQRAACIGVRAYLEEQLAPEAIPDAQMASILQQYPTLGMNLAQLKAHAESSPAVSAREESKRAKVLRAVYSERQLEQVLVDFWFDHFNVDAGDSIASWAIGSYERDAIRRHVLGRFEDMLLATARHPAMLEYLDNAYSKKDTVDSSGRVVKGLNENYGREVLELHTVGVDGGYTQADVVAVARAFTGWRLDWSFATDGFKFDVTWHDQQPKSIMGGLQLGANRGELDGRDVVRFLGTHPMTAERVSRLLVARFVNENPPLGLVMRAQQKFVETGGDLREVMRVILLSNEFLGLDHQRAKVKRPLVFVASLARAAGVNLATLRDRGARDVADLGESLYEAKPPTGYPDVSAAWASPGALLMRFNLLQSYAENAAARGLTWAVPAGTNANVVRDLASKLLAGPVSEGTRAPLVQFFGALPSNTPTARKIDLTAGMVLASPEFMHH